MRVLLIATNRHRQLMSRMEARPLPIGLAYVAGHLDQEHHTVRVLDLMFADDYVAEVEAVVKEFRPGMVGISIRNLGNNSYLDPQWALPTTKEVIQRVRSSTRATIVCGGPAFGVLPRECYAFLEPDLGIVGDAGETFGELADLLEAGGPYHHLAGLVYREGEEVVFNGVRSTSEFSKPPRLEDLDMAKYRQAGFGIGVLTKLGDLSYPTSESGNKADEPAWRVIRPVGDVVQEAKEMKQRFGLRKVFFIDNAFNVPLAHAKSLCQALTEADLKLLWNTCLAPFGCDAELIGQMKGAGCSLVVMGGLRSSRQGDTLEDRLEPLREVCRLCEEGGLHYTMSQSFGEPGETRETVEEKLAFLRELKPAVANLRIGEPVLPGTALAATAVREGLIADEGELIRPALYLDESVRGWIVDHLKTESEKHPRWNLL